MDQLLTISTLSIAELRKVLSDNGVQDTSESKEELLSIASETLLTKMMIDQLQEESEQEYLESVEVSQSMELSRVAVERSRVAEEQQEREQTRLEQELEYEECVQQDLSDEHVEFTVQEDTPLSPRSLRQHRLQYYNQYYNK